MLSSPAGNYGSNNDGPPRERLPSYLLSSDPSHAARTPSGPSATFNDPSARFQSPHSRLSLTPSAQPDSMATPPWLNASRRQGHHVAFNDRLASSDPSTAAATIAGLNPTTSFPSNTLQNPSPIAQRLPPSRMPPNKSLLDTGPPSILTLRSPSTTPAAASLAATPSSRTMRTPASASPGAPGAERWITVFGFSPAMESQVLREFRRHGEIVRTISGKGNWVHVLYRTPLQAQVALYKPWRVLAGTETMIGTVPCTEPQLAREADGQIERGIMVASPSAASPYGHSALRSPVGGHSALRTPASLLRRDQGTPGTPQSIVRTPQKQTGILDYLSGFYK